MTVLLEYDSKLKEFTSQSIAQMKINVLILVGAKL